MKEDSATPSSTLGFLIKPLDYAADKLDVFRLFCLLVIYYNFLHFTSICFEFRTV